MIAQALLAETGHEYANTRKLLEKVPVESFGWKPHGKSMTVEKLATHITMLPQFIARILTSDEIDFATPVFAPEKFTTAAEMVASFNAHAAKSKEVLATAQDEEFGKPFTLRRGDIVFFTLPKMAVIRSLAISHVIHHRAQLQVYLRMLDISVPGFYGPSADEV